jgi:hypothetical protein
MDIGLPGICGAAVTKRYQHYVLLVDDQAIQRNLQVDL